MSDVVDFLQAQCREVWWTCSRLPSSKQVSAIDKRDMVQITEGQASGYSISKRIFTSGHPAIQLVNEVFRKFDELRDDMTIVKSATASSNEGRFQVEPGRRIIMAADIEEFEDIFSELQAELNDAVQLAAHCVDNSHTFGEGNKQSLVPSIKALDKAKLGRSFNEKDYPGAEELQASVKVTSPQYGSLRPEMVLPPAVLERESARISQELGDTVAMAATRMCNDLMEAMDALARNLAKRVYLDPLPDPEDKLCVWLRGLHQQIEVVNVYYTRHDRTIPAGQVRLEVAWKEVDDITGKPSTIRQMLDPIEVGYYNTVLRPREDNERRQLRAGAIDKLQDGLDCLSRIRAMLGESGEELEVSLVRVKDTLRICYGGQGTVRAARELRESDALAEQFRETLQEAVAKVAESADKAIETRRKILV